jgi:SNF2 family DNA or RNA helicase
MPTDRLLAYEQRIDGTRRLNEQRQSLVFEGNVTEDSECSAQPEGIRVPLYPHQLRSLKRMEYVERGEHALTPTHHVKTTLGMLCEIVGAGKTLTMLSFLRKFPEPLCPPIRDRYAVGTSFSREIDFTACVDLIPTNIVVVPHALVGQWTRALAEQTDLSHHVVCKQREIFNRPEMYGAFQVVVVSHTFLRQVTMQLRGYRVHRVAIDEADDHSVPRTYVRNREIGLLATFRWFISSSVSNMMLPRGGHLRDPTQGSVIYVDGCRNQDGFVAKTCRDLLSFNCLDQVVVKCADDYVRGCLNLQPPQETVIRCAMSTVVSTLGRIGTEEAILCLNANDVEGAVRAMCSAGFVAMPQENAVEAITRSVRYKSEDLEAKKRWVSEIHGVAEDERKARLEKIDQAIQGIEERIDTITQLAKTPDEGSCPVCLDSLQEPVTILSCGHRFCSLCVQRVCLVQQQRSTCPMCRTEIDPANSRVVSNAPSTQSDTNLLHKDAAIVKILEDADPDDRYLVFSARSGSFQYLSQKLHAKGVTRFSMVQGNAATVTKTLKKFHEGELRALFLNADHFGRGLDIQVATHIILYHTMDREMEAQVIGRGQRIGRKTTLQIIRLKHTNE